MDSAPLISASLYPALDFVETGENLVGQMVDLGQVPLYLLHTLVIICTDCCGTELVELLMADAEQAQQMIQASVVYKLSTLELLEK